MNSVFNFHIWFVSLLQKDLCVFGVLSNSSGFPVVEGAWWIDLGQMGSVFVVTCNKDWNSERSVTTSLGLFLDQLWSLSTKSLNSHWFIVFDEISLDKLSGLLRQESEIRAEAWVDGSDVLGKDLSFAIWRLVHERRGEFFLCGNDDTVLGLDTQCGLAFGNSCEGVFDLGEFSLWGEGG